MPSGPRVRALELAERGLDASAFARDPAVVLGLLLQVVLAVVGLPRFGPRGGGGRPALRDALPRPARGRRTIMLPRLAEPKTPDPIAIAPASPARSFVRLIEFSGAAGARRRTEEEHMKPWVCWLAIAAGLAAVIVPFVVLRPGEDEEVSTGPTATATGTPTATETGSPTEGRSRPPRPRARARPPTSSRSRSRSRTATSRPGDVEVRQGERVRLVVEADVSDEVHVHGYDLLAEVSPAEPAVIVFRANAPGVFAELEGAGLLLLELTVTP